MDGIDLADFDRIARSLGVPLRRVEQLVRDGHLVALPGRRIPADLVQDGAVVKSLRGVITLLRDARFSDDEIVEWLHRGDDSLPGTPIDALRADRGSEVKRRAQVAGF